MCPVKCVSGLVDPAQNLVDPVAVVAPMDPMEIGSPVSFGKYATLPGA